MKFNWQIKKLGDICEYNRGLTYSKNDETDFSRNIVLRANNINFEKSSLDFSDLKYINDTIRIPKEKKVKRGSIIICTASGSKSHLGKVALINEDYNFAFGGFMGMLTPKKEILSDYLFYNLISDKYKKFIDDLSCGVNINNLKFDDIKVFEIPLPSLVEQARIVKNLDEVFEGINKAKENAEKNLKNARELFESYLQNVFANPGEDWEEKRLSDLFIIRPPKKEAQEKLKVDDLVSFVPMENLQILSKEFVVNKERKLKDVVGSYTYFADEDVLLAKITPCFENGKIGIARNLKNGVGFGSSEYIVFRSKGEIVPDYLFYFLSRKRFREEGEEKMSGAVGHRRVSKDFIENYILPYPKSISEQNSIVIKLDALSEETKKLEKIYEQKIVELEELKKSVLKKAFSGEL